MNKKIKEFCNEVWNEEARRQLEAELNFMSKEKIELPKGKDYLTLFAETHKTDEEIMQEQVEEKDKEIDRLNNIINELKWKPISQYDNGNYDWVLIKMFIKEDNYECIPIVAEKRMGVWKNQDGETLDEDMFEIKYFMDMQQIDKLKELKEGTNETRS